MSFKMEQTDGSQSPEIQPQAPIPVSELSKEQADDQKDMPETFSKEDISKATEAIAMEIGELKTEEQIGFKCDHCGVSLSTEEEHAEHIKAHLLEAGHVEEINEGNDDHNDNENLTMFEIQL